MNETAKDILNLMNITKLRAKTSSQKKEFNKVHARLEDAYVWAKQIDPSSAELAAGVDEALSGASPACTCPKGAVDSGCLLHAN